MLYLRSTNYKTIAKDMDIGHNAAVPNIFRYGYHRLCKTNFEAHLYTGIKYKRTHK